MPKELLDLAESAKEKLKIIRDAKKVYERATKENAKDIIVEFALAVMTTHPEITRVRWEQYTPYFNDGEPCTFTVCQPAFGLSKSFINSLKELGYSEFVYEESENFFTVSSNPRAPDFLKQIAKKQKEFHAILKELEDALEDIFDNDKQITVGVDGIIHLDSYDHD